MTPTSYGAYDRDIHNIEVEVCSFLGTECLIIGLRYSIKERCAVELFDVSRRTIIVGQDNSINKAFDEVFKNAKLFLDSQHVKKNMGPKLGALKATDIFLYERAVHSPSTEHFDYIINHYTTQKLTYLQNSSKQGLYMAYCNL